MKNLVTRIAPNGQALTIALTVRTWTTYQVGILMGSFFLLHLLVSATHPFFSEEQMPAILICTTLLIYAITLAIVSRVLRYRGNSWAIDFGMSTPQMKTLILSPLLYLVFMPLLWGATMVYHLILQQVFGIEITLQSAAQTILQEHSWLKILYISTATLAAPLVEELLFRGILFPYLAKRTGLAGGILLVSALFAAIHFHLPSFLPLCLLSATLCFAYWRTGSLWVCIGFHAIFNAVSILALSIAG